MTKVLIHYYSSWGHVEQMAKVEAEGGRAGSAVGVAKRVLETVPEEVARQHHYTLDQGAPVATPHELTDYDAIISGMPTRYGMMAAQMKSFPDQTGGLSQSGALIGKVGSVIGSTGTQRGGPKATLLSFHTVMLHLGMVVVGLPYSFEGQSGVDQVKGGTPYGATTIAESDGSRKPSRVELERARFRSRHVAGMAARLAE